PLLRDGRQEAPAVRQDAGDPHARRAGRVVRGLEPLQLGPLQGEQVRRAHRRPRALGRGREALRGIHEGVQRPGGARLQGARRAPVLEDEPELRGHAAEHPARRVDRLSGPDHAGGDRGAGPVHPLRHGRPQRGGRRRVLGPDHRMGYLFVTPIALFVLSLVAYPFGYALYLSLTHKLVGLPPVFVGFENYIRLSADGFFQRAVVNSAIFTFGSV